ncbi:hypothetical protein NE664_13855, partial [Anaerotignum faecicola]|nr:hypothetical protein [Anaerotignum faecicola]
HLHGLNCHKHAILFNLVDNKDIPEREVELFKMANDMYPFLPFQVCDMLVIKRGGKNISGTGMDFNMIGRFGVWGLQEPEKFYASGCETLGQPYPLIEIIALLDLTDISHGNAIGMGQADIITKRYFNKIDYKVTYKNGKTTTFIDKIKTPFVA